jgi:TetR/AcrR family transcriptional regulator
MPRTKEQNACLRQQRKKAILHAALSVYVEKGYAASEIIDVADRAGVGKGLVHYYFHNKANLFRELFITMMDLSEEHLKSHFCQEGKVLDLFKNYVTDRYKSVSENRERVLFFMRMTHELKMVFSEEEIKQFKWPHITIHLLSEAISRGMETGEIRSMSPKLLAVQFSGALSNGLAYFIRTMDIKAGEQVGRDELKPDGLKPAELKPDGLKPDGEDLDVRTCRTKIRPSPEGEKLNSEILDDEKFIQDIQDATESCMMILQPNWRFAHD